MPELTPISGLPATSTFATTHWSVVLGAAAEDSSTALASMETLCRTYWYPLYAYARRQGHTPEDAQDLTQGFFAEILGRRDLGRIDRSKGKFRSFLLACMKHFLAKEWRDNHTIKRGGRFTFIPLDLVDAEQKYSVESVDSVTPDVLFDQRWAMAVMEQALAQLRREFADLGKDSLFQAIKPFLIEPTAPGGYDATAEQLNMTPNAVATNVHRLRQRYRELVREAVMQTVTTPLELEEELRHLLVVIGQ